MNQPFNILPFLLLLACAVSGAKPPKAGVTPIPSGALKEALLALNRGSAPWHVRDGALEGTDLIVEWKILDAQWSEIFSRSERRKVFKIYLFLDDVKKTVRSLDEEWDVEWEAGIAHLSLSGEYFRGQKWEMSYGTRVAYTEKLQSKVLYEYRFTTGEMKEPVADCISEHGWNLEGTISKDAVTRASPAQPSIRAVSAEQLPARSKATAAAIGDSLTDAVRGDFFTFFHLKEKKREAKEGRTLVTFKPSAGAFRPLVTLQVTVNAEGKITAEELALARSFIDDPGNEVFARDIAKSLLRSAVPHADRDEVQLLATEIENRDLRGTVLWRRDAQPRLPAEPSAGYLVYAGKAARFGATWSESSLVFQNVLADDKPILLIVIAAK